MRLSAQVDEKGLRGGVNLCQAPIGKLVNDARDIAIFKTQARIRKQRTAAGIYDIGGKLCKSWPLDNVFGQKLRPLNINIIDICSRVGGIRARAKNRTRGIGNAIRLQPIESDAIRGIIFMLSIIIDRAIWPRGLSVIADLVGI